MVRMSEEGLSRRREAISQLKAEVRELEEYSADREAPIWKKRLGPAIANSMKANQEKLEKFLDEPTIEPAAELANVKMLRAGIRAYKHIFDTVENNAESIERKRARIAQLAEEIKQAEDEQV